MFRGLYVPCRKLRWLAGNSHHFQEEIPSGKLTWQRKIRKYIFQWSISYCYVRLPECTSSNGWFSILMWVFWRVYIGKKNASLEIESHLLRNLLRGPLFSPSHGGVSFCPPKGFMVSNHATWSIGVFLVTSNDFHGQVSRIARTKGSNYDDKSVYPNTNSTTLSYKYSL